MSKPSFITMNSVKISGSTRIRIKEVKKDRKTLFQKLFKIKLLFKYLKQLRPVVYIYISELTCCSLGGAQIYGVNTYFRPCFVATTRL